MIAHAKNLELWCAESLSATLANLLESGDCADVVLTKEGSETLETGVHRCILRARLPDGVLLSTLTGEDARSSNIDADDDAFGKNSKKTVVLPGGVNWDALQAWLQTLYSGVVPALDVPSDELRECATSKRARERVGSTIVRCEFQDEQETLSGSTTHSNSGDPDLVPPSIPVVDGAQKDAELHSPKRVPVELAMLQRDLADLLAMPPTESYSDVALTFHASGVTKSIDAHKCILSCRSSYYAAIGALRDGSQPLGPPLGHDAEEGLNAEQDSNGEKDLSKGEVEEAEEGVHGKDGKRKRAMQISMEVNVDGVPLDVVGDVIKFLYSGVVSVRPDRVANQLLLSDQWCLDGLRTAVLQHLRSRVCRKFRKPEGSAAKDIIARVTQVLQLCGAALHYGLSDVDGAISGLRKDCVAWLGQWSTKCWTAREFANLPQSVQKEIRDATIASLKPDACVQMFTDCNQILATLPAVAWSKSVRSLAIGLRSQVVDYILENFSEVSKNKNFKTLMSGGWNTEIANDMIELFVGKVKPENVIGVVEALNEAGGGGSFDSDRDATPFSNLDSQVRGFALRHLMWLLRCDQFNEMNPEAKKKFVSSIERAGINEKPDSPENNGVPKGGSVFVVMDVDDKAAGKRCPLGESRLRNRTPPRLHRRSRSSQDLLATAEKGPVASGRKSATFEIGRHSVDFGTGPKLKSKSKGKTTPTPTSASATVIARRRPSSRSGSIASEDSAEWNNSTKAGTLMWSDESFSSASGSGGSGVGEFRGLRRKGHARSNSDIPKPPKLELLSGLSHFGRSRIPKPPRKE
ncbi:hypothetical protein BSKO_05024 [Bryopsis sp. KO-2023]|nr:hypothetical protein BSKO_05024 [Bryopsis sp. KO-2023]